VWRKNEKKIILISILGALLGLSSCYSEPTMQMFKDGNVYYPNWNKYDNCQPNGSYATCYKDEQEVEKLYPLSENQISYLKYEEQKLEQAKKEFWAGFNSLAKSIGNGYKEQSKAYESILQNQRPNATIVYPTNYKGWIPVY
jgi:hypothetical protein